MFFNTTGRKTRYRRESWVDAPCPCPSWIHRGGGCPMPMSPLSCTVDAPLSCTVDAPCRSRSGHATLMQFWARCFFKTSKIDVFLWSGKYRNCETVVKSRVFDCERATLTWFWAPGAVSLRPFACSDPGNPQQAPRKPRKLFPGTCFQTPGVLDPRSYPGGSQELARS